MSSKKKKEEEYKSDDDEDFVPDSTDVEDPEEVLMDENEEEIPRIGAKNGKKRAKSKDAVPVRVVRKGPFDSDDDLSESESIPSDAEEDEPPSKKSKLEESKETSVPHKSFSSSSAVNDFYAQMKKKTAPVSVSPEPMASTSTSTPTPVSEPAVKPTSVKQSSGTSTDLSDPMAFFAMMKQGKTSTPASSASSTGGSKLAMPSSWLQPKVTETAAKTDSEEVVMTLTGPQKVTLKERYEFAGEQIEVERSVDMKEAADLKAKQSASGLGGILDHLKGKHKITTLQKSKLDWNQFTDQEGLEDEFAQNRKDGYIQKQEFLHSAEAAETAAYLAGKAKARR